MKNFIIEFIKAGTGVKRTSNVPLPHEDHADVQQGSMHLKGLFDRLGIQIPQPQKPVDPRQIVPPQPQGPPQ